MAPDWLSVEGGDPVVHVRVTPKGGRDAIDGVRDGRLSVRVSVPPADGAANEAVRKLLAKTAGVAKSKVALVRGPRSREKSFRLAGVTPAQAASALEPGER